MYSTRDLRDMPNVHHIRDVRDMRDMRRPARKGDRLGVRTLFTSLLVATFAVAMPARAGDAASAASAAPAPAPASRMLATHATLTTAAALQAAQAALARCQHDGFIVTVAVVDRSGQPLAMLRDDLAGAHTVTAAIGKAATAVSFRIDTGELAAATQPGRPQSGLRQLPGIVAVAGGLTVQAKGELAGGIGVSGAPGGDADATCARAGVAAITDALELE